MPNKPQVTLSPELKAKGKKMDFDVVIVGGGLVGMAAAALVARNLPGRNIALIESRLLTSRKQTGDYSPNFDSRSTAMSASSIDIFSDLGLWPEIVKHATEIREVHVSDRGHFGKISFDTEQNTGKKLGYVVENAWLGEKLTESVFSYDNVQIISSAVVDTLRCIQGGVELNLKISTDIPLTETASSDVNSDTDASSRASISSELLILADGANSTLASQLGIHSHVEAYAQHALIANVAFEKPHNGVAFERFTSKGPAALLPLGESPNARYSSLVWTHSNSEIQGALKQPSSEFLSELQSVFGYKLGRFTQVSKRGSYPLSLSVAQEQVRSSIVLLGNAAHALHPVAGQGFNLALRDCVALVRQLTIMSSRSVSLGSLTGLQAYLRSQEKDQWLTTKISDSFNKVFSNEQRLWQGARNGALLAMSTIPKVKKPFFSQMMGTKGRRIRLTPEEGRIKNERTYE